MLVNKEEEDPKRSSFYCAKFISRIRNGEYKEVFKRK